MKRRSRNVSYEYENEKTKQLIIIVAGVIIFALTIAAIATGQVQQLITFFVEALKIVAR